VDHDEVLTITGALPVVAELPPDATPDEHAAAVDLVYVADDEPGIRRRRHGRGFSYLDTDGQVLPDGPTRRRCVALAIPPAWTDVWICPDPAGHIQATGRDVKGRKQYRYHEAWRKARDRDKFERLAEFGAALPDLRRHVEEQIEGGGKLSYDRVVALVLALLDETLIRIGNEEYVENGSHGLTTLTDRHVQWARGEMTFCFPGKSGKEHTVPVDDPRIARLVRRCHQLGGHELFTYRTSAGELGRVSSSDVNEALRDLTGLEVTAKDFRTWGGTVAAAELLHELGPPADEHEADANVLAAVDHAAERLGNTRAVCRASYLDPRIPRAYREGRLEVGVAGAGRLAAAVGRGARRCTDWSPRSRRPTAVPD
jgi:DNA topoisomerase I